MSIRKNFENDLNELKLQLANMCRLAESMIDDAIVALLEKDAEAGAAIKETDKRLDEMEMDIEKKCMRLLLRQQPVAKDFREVSAAMKMITDIERIGDQAGDIGDLIAAIPEEKYFKELVHLKKMGELAKTMVHNSVESFIKNDEALADKTIKDDDMMDKWFGEVKGELIDYIAKDATVADQAITFMMIAKYLERIGDHAVNVCEWTKYNETGVHIKF